MITTRSPVEEFKSLNCDRVKTLLKFEMLLVKHMFTDFPNTITFKMEFHYNKNRIKGKQETIFLIFSKQQNRLWRVPIISYHILSLLNVKLYFSISVTL